MSLVNLNTFSKIYDNMKNTIHDMKKFLSRKKPVNLNAEMCYTAPNLFKQFLDGNGWQLRPMHKCAAAVYCFKLYSMLGRKYRRTKERSRVLLAIRYRGQLFNFPSHTSTENFFYNFERIFLRSTMAIPTHFPNLIWKIVIMKQRLF